MTTTTSVMVVVVVVDGEREQSGAVRCKVSPARSVAKHEVYKIWPSCPKMAVGRIT